MIIKTRKKRKLNTLYLSLKCSRTIYWIWSWNLIFSLIVRVTSQRIRVGLMTAAEHRYSCSALLLQWRPLCKRKKHFLKWVCKLMNKTTEIKKMNWMTTDTTRILLVIIRKVLIDPVLNLIYNWWWVHFA